MIDGTSDNPDRVSNEDEDKFTSMTDIYYLLLADFDEVSDQVENARTHATENQPRQSWSTFLRAQKTGSNQTCNFQSQYKKSFMQAACNKVDDLKLLGEPLETANVSYELRSKLLERVKIDRHNIEQMTAQLAELQASNKQIMNRTHEFDEMMTARTTSGEMKTQFHWEEVSKKVRAHRMKLVNGVRYVARELMPQTSVPDILTPVLKKSLTGQDPYVPVDDSDLEEVEFLLRCNLIVRHPHDRKLIRLSDLLQ